MVDRNLRLLNSSRKSLPLSLHGGLPSMCLCVYLFSLPLVRTTVVILPLRPTLIQYKHFLICLYLWRPYFKIRSQVAINFEEPCPIQYSVPLTLKMHVFPKMDSAHANISILILTVFINLCAFYLWNGNDNNRTNYCHEELVRSCVYSFWNWPKGSSQ